MGLILSGGSQAVHFLVVNAKWQCLLIFAVNKRFFVDQIFKIEVDFKS